MDTIKQKISDLIKKYKYAALVLILGIALMLLPGLKSNEQTKQIISKEPSVQSTDLDDDLESILAKIEGVGRVEVMLTVSRGEETYFQTNRDESLADASHNLNIETVIISDNDKNEYGLITRIDPVKYKGAVVLCQGADKASIRLAIIDAVSKTTGLGADDICVLKMK